MVFVSSTISTVATVGKNEIAFEKRKDTAVAGWLDAHEAKRGEKRLESMAIPDG